MGLGTVHVYGFSFISALECMFSIRASDYFCSSSVVRTHVHTTDYNKTLFLQKFNNNCARNTYMHDHRQTKLRID